MNAPEKDCYQNPEGNDVLLTQAQVVAMPMLAAGVKKQDVAAAVGVCPQTVSEWLRQEHFAYALQAMRKKLRCLAAERISEATDMAVSTVIHLMKCGHETTRLKAATFILEHVFDSQQVSQNLAAEEDEPDPAAVKAVRLAREAIKRLRQRIAAEQQPSVPGSASTTNG